METTSAFDDSQAPASGEPLPSSDRPASELACQAIPAVSPDKVDAKVQARMDAIRAAWAADWDDPREDIYTIEDGEPIDDTR